MSLTELAPELISQIFHTLHSINDVVNLSLTCRHLNQSLKHSQKLTTLFSAAEREFGPVADVVQLVTYNASQPAHLKRQPPQTYALLRQMIKIGGVAQKIVEIYPERRWQDNYLERRVLTIEESWKIRRAVYRYWLYCEAFQSPCHTRSMRMLPHLVEERSQLLRTWSTVELIEVEDVRLILEDAISTDLCPANGPAHLDFKLHCDFSDVRFSHFQNQQHIRSWNSWPPDPLPARFNASTLFHSFRDEQFRSNQLELPAPQRRKLEMAGWGDEISQYYVVQDMMKLNPAQIMHMYETIVRKEQLEKWLLDHVNEDWFWDNGQTWFDTWRLVLYKRGEDLGVVRDAILDTKIGITVGSRKSWTGQVELC